MRNLEELVFRVYEGFSSVLEKPLFGKPLSLWLKYAIMYSFVVWLGVIAWNGYNHYQTYQRLLQEEKLNKQVLSRKKATITRYKNKIRDIRLAYREISRTISPENVKALMETIDGKVESILNQKRLVDLNPLNPYRVGGFNIKIPLHLPEYLESVTFRGVKFPSRVVRDYSQILQKLFAKWDKQYSAGVRTKVNAVYKNSQIVLYLKRDSNGLLTLKPVGFYGVIDDFQKLPFIPTATASNSALLMQNINFSRFYFGWDLILNQ